MNKLRENTVNRHTRKEDNLMQQSVSRYLPYWPLFLISAILGLVVAFIYIRYKTTPVYEANAKIIIKDEKKGTEESKLLESLDLISSKKIVENEVEIIQSRKLMEGVVRNLGLYAPIYQKGRVHTVLAFTKFPIAVFAKSPDSLKTAENIEISFNPKEELVTLNNQNKYPLDEFVETPFGELKFVINKNFSPAIEETESQDRPSQFFLSLTPPSAVAGAFLTGLKADPTSKLSSIVDLRYRDQNPVRAEKILNELIHVYQLTANEEKDLLAKNTLDFVTERLNIVAHDLDSIQKEVQQYKSSNQAVDISTQGQLFLQNVSANDQRIDEVNTQLDILNQVEKYVKSNTNSPSGIVPSTLGVSDPLLSQLTEQLYNTELEYNKLKKTVGENNPNLVALSDKINKLKPSILSNIQSQRQTHQATKRNLITSNNAYNSLLRAVPTKERQLLEISRAEQLKSNLYEFLLQKKEESEIAAASNVFNSKVVDYAIVNWKPVGPKKLLIYLMALMVFIGLAGVLIFVKEHLTGKLLYRSEIENLTDIPVLGEIAYEKSEQGIVIKKGTRSFVAEEFRKLRISLSFLGIEGDRKKKILITSSIPGEGKSFIATNLAISLSLTGKRVVLVDIDLNNPTINKILNIERQKGITEFLQKKTNIENIIRSVEKFDDLYFISPGLTLPDSPTELLANSDLKDLIQYLDKNFDFVIIDTSPIALVTDGYLLSELSDATLYVARHNYTPKVFIKRLEESFHINPIKNPAIVFNGVKPRGFLKKSYGYGYGYGYDYVYGKKNPYQKGKEKGKLNKVLE